MKTNFLKNVAGLFENHVGFSKFKIDNVQVFVLIYKKLPENQGSAKFMYWSENFELIFLVEVTIRASEHEIPKVHEEIGLEKESGRPF